MELLERVGLPAEYADRYPHQLSGGQQQRVGVARALAADPPVMLMDEPFSAVDPVVREQLQDEFLRLQSELGKTILFVTHDIDEAVKLGDQVAVLRVGGQLAQMADPATLLGDPHDEFVADFVGRDRGYRGLGFQHARRPCARPTSRRFPWAASAEEVRRSGAEWVLVVEDDAAARLGASPQGRRGLGDPHRPAPRRDRRPAGGLDQGSSGRGAVLAEPGAGSSSTTTAGCSGP